MSLPARCCMQVLYKCRYGGKTGTGCCCGFIILACTADHQDLNLYTQKRGGFASVIKFHFDAALVRIMQRERPVMHGAHFQIPLTWR